MKLFKHKKNDRKESIKTKAEQATVVLLTKIFQKFGVNNACERLLYLANLHTSFLCNLIYPTFSRILLYSC